MLKREKILMIFLMMLSFVSFFTTKAEAAEEKGDIIKQIYLTDSNGNRPTDDTFDKKDTLRVNVIWSVPDNSTVNGDYFAFTLPDILAVNKDLNFDLTDQSGEIVAKAHLDSQTKRVVVTFNEYVETHSNVRGTMFFNAKFDKDKIDGEGDHHLEFTEDDGTIFNDDIHVTDEDDIFDRGDEILRKFGYFDANDPNLIHWVIRVNVKGIDIHDAMLTDEIGEGHSLVRDSLKVSKLKYKVIDGKLEYEDMHDVTSESNIEIPNDNKFIIYFGDILGGDGYYINYDTRLVGDGNTSNSYTNKASLIGNDEEVVEDSETHKVDDGGGDAKGDTGSLKIIKKDSEDEEKLLSGAEFNILDSNEEVVAHLITNESGEAIVKDLKYGDYQLIETKAPEGYEIDETPIDFTISEEKENILLEIKNTKSDIVEPLGNLELIKVDSKDKEKRLSGAEFDVLDSNKEVVAHVVTDKNGKAIVKELKYGNYQLIETKAPDGYELDKTPVKFSINEKTSVAKLKITNVKKELNQDNKNTENGSGDNKEETIREELPKTNEDSTLSNILLIVGLVGVSIQSVFILKKFKL